ncbi:MAG: tRNA (adenosine(37)-N6)-dimethylallyltransferase MiaA [Candidatus Taylorbacteria bacterium]|nr:tRNA (adenosine(37)-N6)-dimethylallyltransferase MiaA [Candidatus Taylorbacteria bacterium]
MQEKSKQKILVIVGYTATGKSSLAIKLAKKFNGEIISADSRQVYKGLNIGTGKVSKKEMSGVPHHLLDVANPKSRFNVVKYQDLASKKIQEILQRKHLPIICGGTGFYISAVVYGITLPDVLPNAKLRADLAKKTPDALFKILLKLDPVRAENVDRKNLRRVIRAIEIATALGKVPNLQQTTDNSQQYEPLLIGLTLPPNELKDKIKTRLLSRIEDGMIDEAEQLHKKGLSWKRMEELGLEYRYLAFLLQNKISKSEMVSRLQTEIWHYAKRQMTWFKRDNRIKWFNPSEFSKIIKEAGQFLRN